jgi:hypothetical protein
MKTAVNKAMGGFANPLFSASTRALGRRDATEEGHPTAAGAR